MLAHYGVACALPGIKNTDQVALHPVKGPLFENLIVSELLKDRFNPGEPGNIFYWRDKTGHEVNILTENDGKLTAIEIKAGVTANPDFFKGLDYFAALEAGEVEKRLVYGGNQSQSRSNGIRITP